MPRAADLTPLHALLALVVVCGGVVWIEPAPYDLLLVGALLVGPLLAWPSLRPSLALPYLLAALLLLASGASLVLMPDLRHGLAFAGVTAYLVLGWAFMVGWLDRLGPSLLRALLHAHALGAALTGALAVAAYFGLAPGAALMLPDGRLQGLFKDPNVFGAFMVPAVLVAVARLGHARASSLALLLLGTLAVLLSYSRGAWINLTLALLTYAALQTLAGRMRPTLGRVAAAVVVLGGLGCLLVLAFDHPAVRDMLEIRASAQGYDHDRFANQADALALALEHPLGIGPGATEGHLTISAHSLYVRAFVESGLLGLWATAGLVLATLARALWAALQGDDPDHQRRLAVVAAALAGAVVESAVIDSIHWRHLWLLLALGWAPRAWRAGLPR
ncbi:MAG: O-antigen ligase family protein [Myxococcales bacterium]|nr:O-antigen ligase family protein [Myxococcales bacterium]